MSGGSGWGGEGEWNMKKRETQVLSMGGAGDSVGKLQGNKPGYQLEGSGRFALPG